MQRVGHKTFFVCAGVTQAAALGLMALCIHANSFAGWIVCFLTVGTIYGGCHGVIPVFLNQARALGGGVGRVSLSD